MPDIVVRLGRRPLWAVLICSAVLSTVPGAGQGCGGDGVEAPRGPETPECKRADEYLAVFYDLLDRGELTHFRSLLSEDVSPDLRTSVVSTLLRLVDALPPGTFTALDGIADQVDDAAELLGLLARALRFITEDGPGAPYEPAFGSVRRLLQTCEGPPVLQLVDDVIADHALQQALLELLAEFDLAELVAGVELDTLTGRPAIKALARNVMVAATDPAFDVDMLLELLALVIDLDAPPWDGVVQSIRRLLGPGPSLQAIQGLLVCLLEVDPELHLVDLLLDLLTDEALDLADELLALTEGAGADPGEPLIAPELEAPLRVVLGFLIDDAPARAALVEVLSVALSGSRTVGVLTDVAVLLEADVVGDVLDLLVALASKTCEPP